MPAEQHIERQITDRISVEAWPTGRKDDRGELTIIVYSSDCDGRASMTPTEARRLASTLVELADIAEKFSTRGYVGSDE